jgi:hypothetical protein
MMCATNTAILKNNAENELERTKTEKVGSKPLVNSGRKNMVG